MTRCPPESSLFPYTTLFRSSAARQFLRLCLGRDLPELGRGRRQRPGGCGGRRRQVAGPERGPQDRQQRRSEEHTSELQSHSDLVCRLLLEKKNPNPPHTPHE